MSSQHPEMVLGLLALAALVLGGIRTLLLRRGGKSEIEVGNAQTIGRRQTQEDAFATVVQDDRILAVLADGMGGYSYGRMASNLVVDTFKREFIRAGDNPPPPAVFFRNTAFLSNRLLLEENKGTKSGTTLVAALIVRNYLYWASIGDSAIVLFREGEFIHLNEKQTFQALLEKRYLAGEISREELVNHPKKKRLSNYIGFEGFRDIEINRQSLKLRRGDKVILCCDGVYNSLTELEMEKILSSNLGPHQAAEAVISLVEQKNIAQQDNATIIILEKNN